MLRQYLAAGAAYMAQNVAAARGTAVFAPLRDDYSLAAGAGAVAGADAAAGAASASFAEAPACIGARGSTRPNTRLLAGQARTSGSRQTMAALTEATRATNVMTQAATRLTGARLWGVVAASRSMAVTNGNAGPGAASYSTSGSARNSSGSGSVVPGAVASDASQSPPQRAQRTLRCGVIRDAGTSYSAAQLGHTIRIDTHYGRAWTILETKVAGGEVFHRRTELDGENNISWRAGRNDSGRRKR